MKIVEKSSGILPITAGNPNKRVQNSNTLKNLIEEYQNHPSTVNIKNQTNLNIYTYIIFHKQLQKRKLLKI